MFLSSTPGNLQEYHLWLNTTTEVNRQLLPLFIKLMYSKMTGHSTLVQQSNCLQDVVSGWYSKLVSPFWINFKHLNSISMTLIDNAQSSVALSSGYTAQSFYLLPRKTSSIHHHQYPRRLEGDSFPNLLDFSSLRHQCLRMRRSVTVLGPMFSVPRDCHRLSVLPVTKKSTGKESFVWLLIPLISPSIIFSGHHFVDNTTILWLQ